MAIRNGKSTILLICYDCPNYNAQEAFVIIFIIGSDIYNSLRSLCTLAIRTENEKEKRKSSLQANFSLFWCISCTATPEILVQNKIPTIRPLFPDYLSVSCDYAVKLQTCVTNEFVYYLSSIKDDVWYNAILLLLNFSYETKYKSSHVVC